MSTRIHRIVSGRGGDCELIIGSEKTALVDCGMAYCAPRLVEQLVEKLQGRPLDYVLPTHTHYDHIGGMPYLRNEWPQLQAVGNAHGRDILERENALKSIRELSAMAAEVYGGAGCMVNPYQDNQLHIDLVVRDGDRLHLGDRTVLIMETPGHTNCSLSYYLEEENAIFTGESMGCYCGNNRVVASVLTNFDDAYASIERCRRLHADQVVSCHHGLVEDVDSDTYFIIARRAAEEVFAYVENLLKEGMSQLEVVDAMQKKYWTGRVLEEQPHRAFRVNATATVKTVARNMENNH